MTITIEEIKMLYDFCYVMLLLLSMIIVYMSSKLRAMRDDIKFLKDEVEKLSIICLQEGEKNVTND